VIGQNTFARKKKKDKKDRGKKMESAVGKRGEG